MRKHLIVVVAALALVCASTALAGGWATVKLELVAEGPGPPASRCRVVDITVLQHGLASQPLCCLSPTVTIRKVAAARSTSCSSSAVWKNLPGEVDGPHRRLPGPRRASPAQAGGATRSSTA